MYVFNNKFQLPLEIPMAVTCRTKRERVRRVGESDLVHELQVAKVHRSRSPKHFLIGQKVHRSFSPERFRAASGRGQLQSLISPHEFVRRSLACF